MSNLTQNLLSTIPLQIECLEAHLRLFKQRLENGNSTVENLLGSAHDIHSAICGIIDDLELLEGCEEVLPDYLSQPTFPEF